MTKFLLACILLLSLANLVNARNLSFTAIPDDLQENLKSLFDRLAPYLSKELDFPVEYVPVKSYPDAIEAFRTNRVQLAWFGGLSGVMARRVVPNSEAIVRGYEDIFFKSYFIAHHRSGITPSNSMPEAIIGKKFLFGSELSTSGRLIPEYYLRKFFLRSPKELFKEINYSRDHVETIELVQSGEYPVGAVNFRIWEREMIKGNIDVNKVSIIWETPTYPNYHWTIRNDVEAAWGVGTKEKVKQTLLTINDPEILNAFPRLKFVPTRNEDFDTLALIAEIIGLL